MSPKYDREPISKELFDQLRYLDPGNPPTFVIKKAIDSPYSNTVGYYSGIEGPLNQARKALINSSSSIPSPTGL